MPINNRALRKLFTLFALCNLFTYTHADTLNVSWDNDLLTGTDRGYTNGVKLSYLTADADDQSRSSAKLASGARASIGFLPGLNQRGQQQALAFSLRQLMVTPADISSPVPSRDGLPYAGYLSASSTLWSWNSDQITGYGIHIGVIGPESGAEASQKWVHKLTGSERPKGWNYQLGTDVVGGLQATHGRKVWKTDPSKDLEQDISLIGSARLSSFRTNARVGMVWRTGQNMPTNFIPDYAGTSSTVGMPGALASGNDGWSIFVGLGLDYVPYSYLDSKSGPYRFDESLFQAQAGVGGTLQWRKVQFALVLRATNGEKQTNKENFSFGTLSATWAL